METAWRAAWGRSILTAVNDCRECALGWEIVFTAVALMAILVSDIGDSQDGLGVKLTLDAYAVLVARRQLVIINSKAGYVRGIDRPVRQVPGSEGDAWVRQANALQTDVQAEGNIWPGVVHVIALNPLGHEARATTARGLAVTSHLLARTK